MEILFRRAENDTGFSIRFEFPQLLDVLTPATGLLGKWTVCGKIADFVALSAQDRDTALEAVLGVLVQYRHLSAGINENLCKYLRAKYGY